MARYTKEIQGPYTSIIFAQFDNQELKSKLETWARNRNCRIWWGEPNSPDIIAVGYFVSIIDRDIVGRESYESYLAYTSEANAGDEICDETVCVIVDNIRNIELPNLDIILHYDLRDKRSIPWIIHSVSMAKESIDSST